MPQHLPTYEELFPDGNPESGLPSFDDLFNNGIDADREPMPTNFEYLKDRALGGFSLLMGLAGVPISAVNMLDKAVRNLNEENAEFYGGTPARKSLQSGITGDSWDDGVIPGGFMASQEVAGGIIGYENLDAKFPEKGEEDFLGMPLKVAGGMAEFAGGSVVPSGLLINKLVGTAAKSTAAATELGSVVLGGAGMEIGGDVAANYWGEDNRPTGKMLGALMSLTPYALPTAVQATVNKIQGLIRKYGGDTVEDAVVTRKLMEELHNVTNLFKELEEAARLSENIPGFQLTLGQASNAKGLLSLEEQLARASQEGTNKAMQLEQSSLAAVESKLNETFPNSEYKYENAPANRLRAINNIFNKELRKLDNEIIVQTNRIKGIKSDPEIIGKKLSTLLFKKKEIARNIKNSKYQIVYSEAEEAGITFAKEGIANFAGKILKAEDQTFAAKSPVLQKIYNKYVIKADSDGVIILPAGMKADEVPTEISFKEMHSMLKETSRELRQSRLGDPSTFDQHLIGQLEQMKGYLKESIESLKTDKTLRGTPTVNALEDADKYYLGEYKKVYFQGVGGRMAKYNRYGPQTEPEKIVTELVLGRTSGIDDFSKIYGQSREAYQLLEEGIMDAFYKKAIKHGEYNESGAKTFLDTYEDALAKVPELRNKLSDRINVHDVLQARQKVIKGRQAAVHNSRLQGLTGKSNIDELFEAAVRTPTDMAVFRTTILKEGSEAGLNSMKHDLSRFILNRKNPMKYITDNNKALKIAYGDDFDVIHDLADGLQRMGRSGNPRHIETTLQPLDIMKKKTGVSMQEGATLTRHTVSGFISIYYSVPHVIGKSIMTFRTNKLNDAFEEALYNPEMAATMMKGIVDKQTLTSPEFFKLRDRLYSAGIKVTIGAKDEFTDEEVEELEEFL